MSSKLSVRPFRALSLLSCLIICSSSYSQSDSLGIYFRTKAEGFAFKQNDSAIIYGEKALTEFQRDSAILPMIDMQRFLIPGYIGIGKYREAREFTLSNWMMAQRYLDLSQPDQQLAYAITAAERADLYRYEENYIEASDLFEKAFSVIESIDSLQTFMGNSQLVYLRYNQLAIYYNAAAICLMLIGDHFEAINYYKTAYRMIQHDDHFESPQLRSDINYNLGSTYNRIDLPDSARKYYQIALDKLEETQRNSPLSIQLKAYIYRGLSNMFLDNSQLDSAKYYSLSALDIITHDIEFDKIPYTSLPQELVYSYSVLISIYLKLNQVSKAREINKLALNELKNNDEAIRLKEMKFDTFFMAGKIEKTSGNYTQALYYVDQAIQECTLDSLTISTPSSAFVYQLKAFEGFIQKIQVKRLIGQQDSLLSALGDLQLASDILLDLRQSFTIENSKIGLVKKSHTLSEEGLLILEKLNELDPHFSKVTTAFELIESVKSILLYEALVHKDAKLGLSNHLLTKERKFKRDIAYYKKTLFETKSSTSNKSDKARAVEENLFDAQQAYKRFQDTLETQFPSYYQEKYKLDLASLEDITSKLQPHEAFLQYFVGDSNIFVMGIHPETQLFERIPFTDSLLSRLQAYLDFLSSPVELESIEKGQQYTQNAYILFQKLLSPILTQLPNDIDRLIISPDGILSYLPFEALLTEVPEEDWRYSDLPYLLHSYATSYTHSATHWLEQQEKSEEVPPNSWLGFAPSYEETQITESVQPLVLNRFLTRDGSVQLPHAQEEITQISQMVGGQGLFQTSALESDFHREAAQYQVLHLATHGLVEDQQPMYSKLVFAPEADSSYDGFLHAYEIYNMELPANLVVLSACNTGVGKLEKGEGIMSLSRAFFYAGVKSLLMSLWSVSDESTSELMVSFYEGLKAGKDKDLALQQAKVTYIQNQEIAMKSHPYFWAGFVLKGDAGALSLKSSWGYWGYFLLGFLVLLGLVIWVRSSRKKFGD